MMVLPGDGVGREVIRETMRVVDWFARRRGFECTIQEEVYGGQAYAETGVWLRDGALDDMRKADAILFGAIGAGPAEARKRYGLLPIRKSLGLYSNIRPIQANPALLGTTPFRPEIVEGVDMVIVRELNGGIYFGEPRGIETLPDGQRRGYDTQVYTTSEIQRIARVAFELARGRKRQVTSVDKSFVLESSKLWQQEVQSLRDKKYPDIELKHMNVDNCALQLVRAPKQFDVLLTDNIFGDILSDCAGAICGSLGMMPSASFGAPGPDGRRPAFFEPVHGAAPDIAGRDIANPTGAILSFGMALEHAFDRREDARLLARAVDTALAGGARTADIAAPGQKPVSTTAMGDAVLKTLDRMAADAPAQRAG